jgi:hypothetical protein
MKPGEQPGATRSLASRFAARLGAVLLALGALAAAPVTVAQTTEPYDAGWALFIDNDALTLGSRDHDYTGGLAVTLAGRRAREWWFSLDPVLSALDTFSGAVPDGGARYHALQFSVLAFTPGEIEAAVPLADDRPYASIVYLANSRTTVAADDRSATQSSFALGLLGTDLARGLQQMVHDALDTGEPNGWRYQIARGGEPTARYTVARLNLRAAPATLLGHRFELKDSWALSAGYLTEANAALSLRWGRIHSPWWSFTPERAEYMMEPAPVLSGHGSNARESYVWAGVKARARAYNALLQGQFRDSAVRYDFDETRPLIGEAWLGFTQQIGAAWRLSWVLRWQSSELREGAGDRSLVWGGVSLSHSLGGGDRR